MSVSLFVLIPFKLRTLLVCSSGSETQFRTAAYEAIGAFVTNATPDVIPVVQNTAVVILQRMEHLLGMQVRF